VHGAGGQHPRAKLRALDKRRADFTVDLATSRGGRIKHSTLLISLMCSIVVTPVESVGQLELVVPIEIAGLVTDVARTPVGGAEVTLERGPSGTRTTTMTRTAPDGKFSFTGVEPGSLLLTIRRIGFRAYSRSLLADTLSASRPIHIILESAPLTLDTVRVEAAETGRMSEFYSRKKTRGSGHFIDREEIVRRNAAYTSDLLSRFPGVVVRPSSRGGNVVRVRGCRPGIWIDGIQANNAELDEMTRPDEIAAMEVYASSGGVPPQYRDRAGRNCGAIFVWTRIR
jgi:hypothetical protein